MALKNGEAHIAPIHLLDIKTGTYNIPAIKELFSGRRMALIKGVGRVQGLMVKKGNPLKIKGVNDLTSGCRYVNRQRGAGTRLLLDHMLQTAGINSCDIVGYEREAATHMAVAAAVSSDGDVGMGILSAAKAMDLDFIPVGNEQYDFAIPAEFLELEHIRSFIAILKCPQFHRKLAELGGYSAEGCGDVVFC